MTPSLPFKAALSALVLCAATSLAQAQGCTNVDQYPETVVVPGDPGVLKNIATCSYLSEYSAVGPVVAGSHYQFNVSPGGYITIREGTSDGPVIAAGYAPVTATPTGNGNLYAHWNVDAACATSSSGCKVTTVKVLNCMPPTASVMTVDDCATNQFTVNVNVTDLGDGPNVSMIYTVNGGALQTLPGVQVGTTPLGPFSIGASVNLTITHGADSLCNLTFNNLVSANTCPTIVQCGGAPLDQTYCYTNNDLNHWHYLSNTPGLPLIMIFSAGTIESASYDHLRIYDGPNNQGTLLFDHTQTSQFNLTALQVVAPSGEIWMENSSDGSSSCASGTQTQWAWQVGCLDCVPASATYTVQTDCAAQVFTVDVHITALGSDPSLDITNNAGAAVVTALDTGVYTVGPFPITTLATLTLVNSDNNLCNVTSPVLTNPLCESVIQCGGAPLDQTYCYGNNDAHAWSWASSTGDPLIAIFSAGTIESAFTVYDHIRIYNGTNNLAPLIYENVAGTTSLVGLQAIAPSGHMYMEMTSDGSGSCNGGTQTQWAWQVGCLDCVPPVATYSVVTNCDSMQFNIAVTITTFGSDPVLDIMNDGGALPVAATGAGTYITGPFAASDTVIITLVNDMNSLCNIHSAPLTNPLCPTIVTCGGAPLADTYCYQNSDNHEWHWQSSGGQPLAIQFTAGTIESEFTVWDHIRIYDGVDNTGTLIYENVSGTTTLAGVLAIASSGDLYMQVSSDFINSCEDGSYDTWVWSIGCLDCTNPVVSAFNVVKDCIHHAFSVEVNVDSTGSSPVVRIANSLNTDTLANVGTGITTVGPFPMDSTVVLTVMNESNALCRVFSPALTEVTATCVDSVCAATAYEYCYTNNDTAWFLYQGTANVPLTIQFLWGQMLAGDFVQIFDGGSPTSTLLWQGNLNGNMAGLVMNTNNAQHKLLMRVVSNAIGSCATGQAFPPLHWVVECGAVGVNELSASAFSMYPNPTTGELTLRLPAGTLGSMDLRITDLTGRAVYHERFNAAGPVKNFDLKELAGGNYTVTLTTNTWVKSQQLQIIH